MRKSFFVILGVLAALTMAGTAAACPTEGDVVLEPQQRPVLQQTSAQQLFERAQALESAAVLRDRSASAFDRQAETFAARARALRTQAQLVSFEDRPNVVALADELGQRASASRMRASEERSEAQELRVEASALRTRANQLVRLNQGGGWRGRRPMPSTSSAAATSI